MRISEDRDVIFKMKVLLVSMRMDIGGAETHILELARELNKRGHYVKIASEGGVYVDMLSKEGIGHIYAPLASKKISDVLLSYKTLSASIKEEKFDIVHSHARIPNFIIKLLKMRYNFGFVSTLHFAFTKNKLVEKFSVWGEKNLAVSDDLRRHLIKNSHVKAKNVVTTVNGINPIPFEEENDCDYLYKEFSLKKDSKKIVCVCRLERSNCESMYALVKQAENINKKLKNVQLLLVGDGESFDELKTMADKVNRKTGQKTVVMMGARQDVNNIIKISDVFVGISRAALEAMMAGKIVVLTGSYGHHGVLFEKDFEKNMLTNFTCRKLPEITPQKVFDSVCDAYLMDKERKNRTTEAIKLLVKENFSASKMCDDALSVYKALCSEKKNGEIVLSGYYGFSNSGDDAILKMIIRDIKERKPDAALTILSNKPQEAKNIYKVNAVNRWNIFAVIKALKKSKVFVSGGGSVIQDATSTKSLLYYLMLIILAKRYGNKVMLYANGIGPVRKKANIKRTKNVLNKADIITLRETDSEDFLEELGVLKPKIKVTCDPAIGLSDIPMDEAEDILFRYDLFTKKYIIVSLREWKDATLFENEFKSAVKQIKKEYGYEVLFIPLQHTHDLAFCRKMAKETGSICIERRLSAELCIALAKRSEFVVGMRLHMLIYAFVAGVPSLGISYDPKVESVMKYFGQDTCVGILEFTKRSFLAKANRIVEKRNIYCEELKLRLKELKEKNKDNIDCVMELLGE